MRIKNTLLLSFLTYSLSSAFFGLILAQTPLTLVYVTPKFSGIDFNRLIESCLVILLLSGLNPVRTDSPFYLLFLGVNFFIVIPLVTFRFCTSQYPIALIDQTLCVIMLGLIITRFITFLPYRIKKLDIPFYSNWDKKHLTTTLNIFEISTILVILASALKYGLTALKLDYTSIYTRRISLRFAIQESSFLAYALSNVEQFILPCLLVIGLYLRKWRSVIISVAGSLIYFAMSGSRSTLAMVLLIPLLFYLHNSNHAKRIIRLTGFMFTFSFFSLVTFLRETSLAQNTYELLLRTFVSPGIGSLKYTEFFNSFSTTSFKQSRLIAYLLGEPPIPVTYLMGKLFYNNSQQNFNSNVWSDALISGGLLGVITISILLGFALFSIRLLLVDQAPVWTYPLYGYIALNFIEQSFLTAFLSGGLLLAILFSLYVRKTVSSLQL